MSAINNSSNGVPFWYSASYVNNASSVAATSEVGINPDKDEMMARIEEMNKLLKEIDKAYKACKDDAARAAFRASLTDANNPNGFCRRLNDVARNLSLSNEKLETNFWISTAQHDLNDRNIAFIKLLTSKPEAATDAQFIEALDVAQRALASLFADTSKIK